MSLINDALKKAARQRAEELADVAPPMPGGGGRGSSRQGQPMRTQTLVLIGGAAVALVIVSAVITGILMAGKPEPKPVAAAPAPTAAPTPPPAAPKASVPAPAIVVSVPKPMVPTPTAAPTSAPVVLARPAPAPSAAVVARAQESSAAAPESAPNDGVQGVVDRYRVSGVRAAGSDSKALIDGHVYKVNEITDHKLGLKLVKVEADHLTFVDRDGATYMKSF